MSDWTWTISWQKDRAPWVTLYQASGWDRFKIKLLSIIHIVDQFPPYSLSYKLCCWAGEREDRLWKKVVEIPLTDEQSSQINSIINSEE